MAILPAITVYQPWAALIAECVKPVEFRDRRPPEDYVGKRVAIHAAARPVRRSDVQRLLLELDRPSAKDLGLKVDQARVLLERILASPKSVPLGCVICTAILGEPRDEGSAALLAVPGVMADRLDDDDHIWGWPLSEIRTVTPPAPAVGKLGWWTWKEA